MFFSFVVVAYRFLVSCTALLAFSQVFNGVWPGEGCVVWEGACGCLRCVDFDFDDFGFVRYVLVTSASPAMR